MEEPYDGGAMGWCGHGVEEPCNGRARGWRSHAMEESWDGVVMHSAVMEGLTEKVTFEQT